MSYSREQIEGKKTISEDREITQNLLNSLSKRDNLKVYEGKYICSQIKLFQSDDPNAPKLDALDFSECDDYIFIEKYITYFRNFEGWDLQKDAFGEIQLIEKRKDVAFLDKHYLSWKEKVIENSRLSDELLRHIHIETCRQLKSLKEYCKKVGYGSNHHKHLAKGLILHSKYLYFTVLEYYQDDNKKEEEIAICNCKIIIDSYTYVHILFRHYEAQAKEHQQDKSYHHMGDFNYKLLPKEIFAFLEHYKLVVDCNTFDEEKVFFKLNGNNYALWFKKGSRQIKNKPKEIFYKVETLYPVKSKSDLDKIYQLKEVIIDNTLSIFMPY